MTSTLIARPIETRLRPLYATGFIFEASVFVVGALVVMCATLSVIVVKR